MFTIRLSFASGSSVELIRVDFTNTPDTKLTCIRGKTSGAHRGAGTFQWSSAVRACACIFLKARLAETTPLLEPMLTGAAHSLAASLDYAITKQPGWLQDMFGVFRWGQSTARRLFLITNTHRKRGGPVSISLNLVSCPPENIEIVLDGKVVESADMLNKMLASIEGYFPTRNRERQTAHTSSIASATPRLNRIKCLGKEVAYG